MKHDDTHLTIRFFTRMKHQPGKHVLDIGTFTGYSSLAMAEVLPEDGTVVTLEREKEAAEIAKSNWSLSPHSFKIESRVGEAHDLLEQLASERKSFDLVFLDIDKPGCCAKLVQFWFLPERRPMKKQGGPENPKARRHTARLFLKKSCGVGSCALHEIDVRSLLKHRAH